MCKPLWKRLIVVCAAVALVAGAGVFAPQDAVAAWTHGVSGGYDVWYLDGNQKFRYQLSNQQWWHYSTGGSWGTLSATGVAPTFIGDGGWYTLGNGFTYRYWQPTNAGYFRDAGLYRFFYKYATAQWYHSGNTVSWQLLGNAGISSAFVGMGAHVLGNGWVYHYSTLYDVGDYKDGAYFRFRYRYGPGRWEHTANTLSWQPLSADGISAAFVGSGAGWYVLGNGFTFQYTAASDAGYYRDGGIYRFRFKYGPGQWEHTGNTLSWQVLGYSGRNAAFLGNGAWHLLYFAVSYQYTTAFDVGYIKDFGAYRFRYKYGPRQWEHTGYGGGWYALGAAGLAAIAVADQIYHNLGNGFWYRYTSAAAVGNWSVDGTSAGDRFRYLYIGAGPQQGEWLHRDYNGASWVLADLFTASFMGDGEYHNLGNGFWYQYSSFGDYAHWSRDGDSSGDRFRYEYDYGIWSQLDQSQGYPTMSTISAAGRSGEFIGDTNYHNLGNSWWYQYFVSTDNVYWSRASDSSGDRFRYLFSTGQWQHRDYGGLYWDVGGAGAAALPARFIGNTTSWVSVGNGWRYQYVFAGDKGAWSRDGTDSGARFMYTYGDGRWWHRWQNEPFVNGFINFYALGHAGMSGEFLGDGQQHNLLNGYSYFYGYTNDVGGWLGSSDLYWYYYATGLWQHDTSSISDQFGPGASAGMFNPGE